MRRIIGQFGHASCGRSFGRLGQQLELVHRVAPWRFDVPRQSRAGVAAAEDDDVLAGGQELAVDRVAGDRPCSAAAGTPSRSGRPELAARDRQVARPAWRRSTSTTASNSRRSSSPVTSTPTLTLVRNVTPSAAICSMRRSIEPLLHLEVGDAVAQQAADAVVALEHRHRRGRRARAAARTARPAGPEPTTATLLARALLRRLRARPSPRRTRGR